MDSLSVKVEEYEVDDIVNGIEHRRRVETIIFYIFGVMTMLFIIFVMLYAFKFGPFEMEILRHVVVE